MADDERQERLIHRTPHWYNVSEDSKIYKVFNSYRIELDDLDTEIINLSKAIQIDTAIGQELDDLGRIFRLTRKSGETDVSFRARIKSYWPGFSGGGTAPAIKSTIFKITGVPENQITVTDIPDLKFEVDTILSTPAQLLLVNDIIDTIGKTKAAGVYPLYAFTLGGDLLTENLTVTDTVDLINEEAGTNWHLSISAMGGSDTL